MPSSSQEPRGAGLSTTLVKDFRAILTALEQEKSVGRDGADVGRVASPMERAPGARTPASNPSQGESPSSRTSAAASQPPSGGSAEVSSAMSAAAMSVPRSTPADNPRAELSARAAPAPYAEVRNRIAALGDVRDLFPSRPASGGASSTVLAPTGPDLQAVPAALRPAAVRPVQQPIAEPSSSVETRRRGFGAAARCGEGEVAVRRRRSASKEAFTWQRLGVLAVCIAIAGGGVVALQSVVGREEAEVAQDAIGNAAIATVAPSVPVPFTVAAAPAAPVPPVPSSAATGSAEPALLRSVADVITAVPQPSLRDAEPLFDTPPKPASVEGVTAFAATDETPAASSAAAAPVVHAPALPKQAPLPPPAPSRQVASAAPASAAPAEAAAATAEDGGEGAPGDAVSGGPPIGSVTLRSPVTMRAAPKKGAAPIANLPSGETIQVVTCSGWCEVIADGKRGFVYKSFVDMTALRQAEAPAQ